MFNMELPEEKSVFLFSRMLELFPNLPQEVIHLYSLQYSNDAEMCAKMLSFLSNKAQIEDLQVQNSSVDQSADSGSKHNGIIASSAKESNNFNQMTYELGKHLYYPPVTASTHDNNSSDDVGNLDYFKMAQVNENNSSQYDLTFNGNILVHEDIVLIPKSTELKVQVSPDTSTVNNNSMYESENIKIRNGSCILPMHQGPLPNELHIDIDCDKEFHSWRPNLSFSSLSSDFFLPQTDYAGNLYVNEPGFVQNEIDTCYASKTGDLENSKQPIYQKETVNHFEKASEYPFQQNANNFQPDIQGYLNLQKSHMSILIYELMKTERELKETRGAVERLTYERHLQSKNALDIENLNKENSQLRLECQCLCMEVDFFLKGKARLGEVEDSLCKDQKIPSVDKLANESILKNKSENSGHDVKSEDQEELKKWQCHQCTFANHPAIDACEMCQAHRLRSQNCRFLSSGLTSCYCHPNEKSLPLSS